jgi:hypothetical protein
MRGNFGQLVGGVAGVLLAFTLAASQVGLFVGGVSYRKDCVNKEGKITQNWTFTWLAPIPYLFRPSEPGCVIHTGTRVALNAVGIAQFSDTSSTKIANEAITDDADPDTAYWIKARSALEDYFRRNETLAETDQRTRRTMR